MVTTTTRRCARPQCGGVYRPDLDGGESCILCGRQAPSAPVVLCRARRYPTCPALVARGYPARPAVDDCRHRSSELAPHCQSACEGQDLRRTRLANRWRAVPAIVRTGRCLARNCRPCRAAEARGQLPASVVECVHAKNRRAPHCERLRQGERERQKVCMAAKRGSVGVG